MGLLDSLVVQAEEIIQVAYQPSISAGRSSQGEPLRGLRYGCCCAIIG
jgi:hypothetical protein